MENITSPLTNPTTTNDDTPSKGELAMNEIFKDEPIKNGLSQVSASKIKEVLTKYGFKEVSNPQSE